MIFLRLYMLSLIGLLIYFVQPGNSLFSWHPTFMTIGTMFILYEGAITLDPNRALINAASWETKRNVHSILQILALIVMFFGGATVAMAKEYSKIPHLQSIHSLLGGIAGVLCGFQGAAGLASRFQRLTPVSPKYVKFCHIVLGLCQYFACAIAFIAGIYTNYMTSRTTPFIQIILTTLPIIAYVTTYANIINKFLKILLKPQ